MRSLSVVNMKIKHTCNGNIEGEQYKLISTVLINPESRDWVAVNSLNSLQNYDNRRDNVRYVANINNYSKFSDSSEAVEEVLSSVQLTTLICNEQYRLNKEIDKEFKSLHDKDKLNNQDSSTEVFVTSPDCTGGERINFLSETTSYDEERAFRTPDSDEMLERRVKGAPRGIVNPNYPGFQHLAHTLQDYSSTIENFYQSENDMTDDDVDVEITDLSYEAELKENDMNAECINNNNDVVTILNQTNNIINAIDDYNGDKIDSNVPDLIKTVTKTSTIDSYYDIENNFRTQDIIGDFNKEIEDEIKNVLNYNLNIDDGLEELRKDIKDNFEEPIVNTINNISDVVNQVIKKLVEIHCDETKNDFQIDNGEISGMNFLSTSPERALRQNEANTLKEMNRNRPTFLCIENDVRAKIADAFLSDGKEDINVCEQDYDTDKLTNTVENTIKQLSTELRKIIPKLDEMRERDQLLTVNINESSIITDNNFNNLPGPSCHKDNSNDIRKTCEDSSSKRSTLIDLKHSGVKRSKRLTPSARNLQNRSNDSSTTSSCLSTHSHTSVQNESKEDCYLGSFDVYNIETALPKLDLDAIESHLKAAKEAERRKRNDREEIRRRLAMGAESEENYYSLGHVDRPGRKPSLQSRLQSGMNLQICFMNETASDNESQLSEIEKSVNSSNKNLAKSSIFSKSNYSLNNHPYQTRPLSVSISNNDKISTVQSGTKLRPTPLSVKTPKSRSSNSLGQIEIRESDFNILQATLQTEARIALAQAKELARVQMERERRTRPVSPVTEMLRRSMEKANAPLAADRRRVSRHILTDMNIAQLQVIVNELHSQIESLNESLVQLLMARDELHMGQDSMLVDIEDLTRYLGVKEQTKKTKGTSKSAVRRLAALVNK